MLLATTVPVCQPLDANKVDSCISLTRMFIPSARPEGWRMNMIDDDDDDGVPYACDRTHGTPSLYTVSTATPSSSDFREFKRTVA